MLSPQDFIRLFSIENELIKNQTEGLSQADSLIQPQPSGNCMNWVLGHVLESQITMLTVLGGTSPVDPAELVIYKRESQPITRRGTGNTRAGVAVEGDRRCPSGAGRPVDGNERNRF